jgi:outer membrane protein assembly factor BamE (lipoprotein component of BamABCDE complex)
MNLGTRKACLAATLAAMVIVVLLVVRSLQSPIPSPKLAELRPGMSAADVRHILGPPDQIFPGGQSYTVKGRHYIKRQQWTYARRFAFAYINVHFDTNGMFTHHNFETF